MNESIWERRMNEVITGKCHVIVQTAMPLHPNPKVLSPLQVRSSQCGPLPCCARPVRASAPWCPCFVCNKSLRNVHSTDWPGRNKEEQSVGLRFLSCSCLFHSIRTLVGLPQPCQHHPTSMFETTLPHFWRIRWGPCKRRSPSSSKISWDLRSQFSACWWKRNIL